MEKCRQYFNSNFSISAWNKTHHVDLKTKIYFYFWKKCSTKYTFSTLYFVCKDYRNTYFYSKPIWNWKRWDNEQVTNKNNGYSTKIWWPIFWNDWKKWIRIKIASWLNKDSNGLTHIFDLPSSGGNKAKMHCNSYEVAELPSMPSDHNLRMVKL